MKGGTKVVFYNGFNLLVDILVAIGSGLFFYKAGWRDGYGEGEQDYIEYSERHADYLYDQAREADYEV